MKRYDKKSNSYSSIFILIQNSGLYAQGCSDAGFCTVDVLKPNVVNEMIPSHKFKIGSSYGKADESVTAIANYIEYNGSLSEKISIGVKLTSILQSGIDISEFDLSDIFLNTNFSATESLTFTLGTKIPLSKGDKKKDNLPLPMDYQSSLGTFDLIFGFGYRIENLQLSAAIQQPLNDNDNKFLSSSYPDHSKLRKFHSTKGFKRSGDIMFRISYPIKLNEKLILTPGFLPIYHLSNDKFTDEFGNEKEIDGSKGLTFNLNAYLDYNLGNGKNLQLSLGIPLKVRDKRPDGLTRSFIANLEYRFSL